MEGLDRVCCVYRGITAQRRFQEGLQRVLVLIIEGFHRMRATPIPVNVSASEMRRWYEMLKATTAAKIAMKTTPIPVTIRTLKTRRNHEGST